jgi:hypothetical protein
MKKYMLPAAMKSMKELYGPKNKKRQESNTFRSSVFSTADTQRDE